jgi:hypothetical protein
MRRMLSLAVISAAVMGGMLSSVGPWAVSAHPGPHMPSPPSHDYDTAIPGIQGPTSPVLANPTGRLFSAVRLSVSAIVPLEDLQRILPPGYTANPLPAPNPPGRAGLALNFDFLGQCDRPGAAPSGSAPWMGAFHLARNTALARNELLILMAEVADESFLNCHQALLGPRGSRLAELDVSVRQKNGQLRIQYEVEDEAIGLQIKLRADGPAAFSDRNSHSDPATVPLLTLDQGLFANPAQRFSVMGDAVGIPITDRNFRLTLGRNEHDDTADEGTIGSIGLPGGRVRVVGVMPTFTFQRWFENFFQPE